MSYLKRMKLIFLILPLISLLAISCKVSDSDSDPSGNPVNIAIVDIDASGLFGNACEVGIVEIETEAVPDGTEIEIDESSPNACLIDPDVIVDDGVAIAGFVADYVLGVGNTGLIPVTISLLLPNGTMFEQFTNIPVTGIGIDPPTVDDAGESTTFEVEAAAVDDPDMAAPTPFVFIPVGLAGKFDDLVSSVSNDTLGGIANIEVLPDGSIFVEYQPENGTEGTNILTVTVTLTTPPAIQALCPPGTIGDGAVVTAFITINQTAAEPGMVAMMETNCTDSIDDDGDMMIDCADADCAGDAACELPNETTCDDMLDNDGDMMADCIDADCQIGGVGMGMDVCFEATCDDMMDNDTGAMGAPDGADCADADCVGINGPDGVACEAEETDCADGFDTDGDGDTDCDDNNCQIGGDGSGMDICFEATCDDMMDNDTMAPGAPDGEDCLDMDCDGVGICEFGTETTCDDLEDNDGDGDVDCADTIDCPDTTPCDGGGMCNAGACM